jgi:ABC-2 type transport system permease protein
MFELAVGTSFYFNFLMRPQAMLAFFLSLIIGPALVSADLRNNAMPLYLSRPFNRRDYILGKMCVLILLISVITWIPGLLLFLLQAYLSGFDWLVDNYRTGIAIVAGSWILILILSLASLAISAYMKWKPIAQAAYFGIMLASVATALLVNSLFRTEWGSVLNITDMFAIVWKSLFALPHTSTIPVPVAWLSVLAFCGLCLAVLLRKVRAYEVIK